MPFIAQNSFKLEAYSNTIWFYMCDLSTMRIFSTFYLKKKSLSHFKQILNISNDFRNIASFIKEKLVEILWICLKSSQIRTFPRIFCSRNMLYIENYLEYFKSVWSAKNYFFILNVENICMDERPQIWNQIVFEFASNLR